MYAQLLVVLISVFLIATAAIGLECYSKNKTFWEDSDLRKGSRNFLIFMIVVSAVGILGGIGTLAYQAKAKINTQPR